MPTRNDPATAMPSLTHTVWSWPWTRHTPRRLTLTARACGLTTETEHDGGWLLRLHLITATGPDRAVRRYDRVLRRLARKAAPEPRPPRSLLDLLGAQEAR